MTERRLKELLAYWQPKLGLQAWEITLLFVPSIRLHDPEAHADVIKCIQGRTATIRVANDKGEQQRTDGNVFPEDRDYEEYVVHELLHVVWDPGSGVDWNNPYQVDVYEQAIHATAKALIAVRYDNGT